MMLTRANVHGNSRVLVLDDACGMLVAAVLSRLGGTWWCGVVWCGVMWCGVVWW